MFVPVAAFSGFSVKNLEEAKAFYSTLGLQVDEQEMGLHLVLPNAAKVFLYAKTNHEPATYTVLNLVVADIDRAVEELQKLGVRFEHYNNSDLPQDEKGILRGLAAQMGPDIAWFKDPSGNVISILQEE